MIDIVPVPILCIKQQTYTMTQKEIIMEQLTSMGAAPVELENVGYVFKYDDINYLYLPDDDDEQFLRIVIPHLFDVTEENHVAVLEAIHDTACLLKYAKVCIMRDASAWAIYEHKLCPTDNMQELLEHIIRVLEATALVFQKKMNGEEVMLFSEDTENPSDDEIEAELHKILDMEDENN